MTFEEMSPKDTQLSVRFREMDLGLILLLLSFVPLTLQDCVWYGECNEIGGRFQNCLSKDRRPHDLTQASLDILKRKCPLFLETVPGKEFCCDDNQVRRMEMNMDKAASIFGRCPTCTNNLNLHICHMTCSPDQSTFLRELNVTENGSLTGEPYITAIEVHLSKEYKEKTFDSCKEVTSPSTGGNAMTLSCGVWGEANQCTPERWFEFFGNFRDNILAPFDIDYDPPPRNGCRKLHLETLPCNESYESQRPCSCSDCEASCTVPFEHSGPPEPFLVLQMDGVLFIMSLLYLVLSVAAAAFLFLYHRRDNELLGKKPSKGVLSAIGSKITGCLTKMFTVWGTVCARNPTLVFAISSWIIAGLGYGVSNLRVTVEPTEIWASPVCKSRLDKDYFDSRFTPFYRTNQVFIKSKGLSAFNWTNSNNFTFAFGPAFQPRFLEEVYNLQMQIQELGAKEGNGLEKVCFSPMKNEFFTDNSTKYCVVQSVWGYLQNDVSKINDTDELFDLLQTCVRNNFDPRCLAPYGGPIFAPLAVGGGPKDEVMEDNQTAASLQNNHLLASGVTLTFLLNNAVNKIELEPALTWEKMFIEFLKEWKERRPEFMDVAFSAERSIEDEIERESRAEMTTIIISYLVMFIYITVALGRIRNFSSLLLDSKFTLGVGGITIVLASVIASLGVFGYLGISTTLLTIEVIPFLILAVGVDNIFILVHAYQQLQETNPDKLPEELIGVALGRVGPSILLTSTSEACCFLIGTLSDMPAIKTFAEYSSVAIVLNFLLQISCFVSLLAVDSRRQMSNRADLLCCLKLKKKTSQEGTPNILFLVFRFYYGPFLMKTWVRVGVIMIFIFWLCASIACIPHIERGLDQELSMPEDSYVIDYFQYMKELLSLGPPVYFVVKNGLNYTNASEVNAVCGSVGCDSDSLVTYLTRASKLSNSSYIAKPPSSWIDDYFDWLLTPNCCKQFPENGSFCPHSNPDCEPCATRIEDWRPHQDDFRKYLPYFLNDNPDKDCPKAGHATYAQGVNFQMNPTGQLQVTDNYFMAYHTPLKTSHDFYMALGNSRKIADHLSGVLTNKLNRTIQVFPHSVFYVYYEQYLTIAEDALLSLSLSLLAVFGVTFLLTGFDLRSSCLVWVVMASILVNMTAMLYWWSIPLNAVSLVNLLVAVGIGVEFCSHLVHAFVSSSEPDKISKALHALGTSGSSVFSGITLTKFLGIVVLAFAQTLMLRTFYFRMYLGIVIMGAAHGLVLMPVLLSYFG